MPTLNDYATATQQLLHDPTASLYGSLTNYINEARMRLALQSECVRYLQTISGIGAITPTVTYLVGNNTITSPGIGGIGLTVGMAVVSPILGDFAPNTTLTSISTNSITISPAPLRSDTALVSFYPLLSTAVGQESYYYAIPFAGNLLTQAGIQNVVQVKSVTVNWGGIGGSSNVMLEQWSFTKYQAFLGYYGTSLQGNPAVWCSYNNTVMMRPVPSSVWPMQWDTVCTPIALASSTDVEAIPYPYTDSVKYYAAYLALMNSQNPGNADRMEALYNKTMTEARSFTQRTFVPYVYR